MAEPWAPTRATVPLTDPIDSLFTRYEAAFDLIWFTAFGYILDPWQKHTLKLITELTPDGRLRHSQFIVSLGRQNGKTEIAAALALLWLLWRSDPYVIGIATSAEQARLVYDRVMRAIRPNRSLAGRFDALTDTRGIRSKTGGKYEIKASKSASLQGIPIDLSIVDEVHIVKQALWTDLVNGTGNRPDCLVVGITTAGDDTSALLKHLYELADKGDIGHAIWEAPEARIPEDDDTLWEYLLAANPGLVTRPERREAAIKTVRTTPAGDAIRYRLNRFVSAESTYMPVTDWLALGGEITPPRDGVVFVIDRTPTWSHASIVAAWQAEAGMIETQVVASIAAPTFEKIVDLAVTLGPRGRLFVGDGYTLGALMEELKGRGLPTRKSTLGDACAAASRLYSRVATKTVRHMAEPLMTAQLPRVKTKTMGDNYRLVRAGTADIDTVVATAAAVYFTEASKETGSQLFI